jgi:hypothetical protein
MLCPLIDAKPISSNSIRKRRDQKSLSSVFLRNKILRSQLTPENVGCSSCEAKDVVSRLRKLPKPFHQFSSKYRAYFPLSNSQNRSTLGRIFVHCRVSRILRSLIPSGQASETAHFPFVPLTSETGGQTYR